MKLIMLEKNRLKSRLSFLDVKKFADNRVLKTKLNFFTNVRPVVRPRLQIWLPVLNAELFEDNQRV